MATAAPATSAELDEVITERVESRASAGIVAGVMEAGGARVQSAHGDPGPNRAALDQHSVFEIGSATKVFTGLLLAEMADRREVDLHDPVARYLPATVRVPRRGRYIELADLATHTSGLPRLPLNLRPKDPDNPLAELTVDDLYAFLSSYQLPREVGAEYEYSNLGFGLLGHALALCAGASFEELLVERVLDPLGLSMTRFALTPDMQLYAVSPHGASGEVVADYDNPTLPGAGGLHSTLGDMLAFAGANLDPDAGRLQLLLAKTHAPRVTIGPATSIGLGWHIRHPIDREIVWHNGQTAGSHAFIGLDVRARRAAVVLSNSASSIDDIGYHLLDARIALEPPGSDAGVIVAHELLESYVGVYELAPGVTLTVRPQGSGLTVDATGQGKAPLVPKSESTFVVRIVGARITFERDANGHVTGLSLEQRGTTRQAPKLENRIV